MNCTDVRNHLDGLPPGDVPDPAVALHLARCAECRTHGDALALVDARLGAMHATLDVPTDFAARLSARHLSASASCLRAPVSSPCCSICCADESYTSAAALSLR